MERKSFKQFHQENLQEAPIGDYETIGDWSKRASFRDKRDRTIIRHPRAIEITKKKFGNTEFLFHFYFVNSNEAKAHQEVGLVKPEWLQANLGDEVYNAVKKNLDAEDDGINVVFTNNDGAERMNMTAWIMAHRIGHALARERGSREAHGYREASNHLISQLSVCMDAYGDSSFPDSEAKLTGGAYGNRDQSRKKQRAMTAFFHEVGSFRSAREKSIRDWFEVLNELIAQYLTTGKIKFRPAPKSFGVRGPQGFMYRTDDAGLEEVNDQLDMLSRDMEYYIDAMLGSVCNRVLVM
jgi:hypothetical protein